MHLKLVWDRYLGTIPNTLSLLQQPFPIIAKYQKVHFCMILRDYLAAAQLDSNYIELVKAHA